MVSMNWHPDCRMHLRPGHGQSSAFSILELIIVVGLVGVVAAIGISQANRSLQRSKVNEIALELAGWFESLKTNTTVDVSCQATFRGTPGQTTAFSSGTILYAIESNRQANTEALADKAPSCTNYIQSFRLGLSAISGNFLIDSPQSFQFTRRGTLIAADANDIRIFFQIEPNSFLLRCLRPSLLLGSFRIGSNSAAADTNATCDEASFRAF